MLLALKRVGPLAFFGALPVVFVIFWVAKSYHGGTLGIDFKGELYPEAKLVLHGRNPFPPPHANLSGGVNRIFTIPAAVLAIPLTVLPRTAAAALFVVLLGVALLATLRVMGVTDWRVYGLVFLWPPTVAALQTGNVTVLLGLLGALAWRLRDRLYAPGIAVAGAVALKLILWPLLVWLAARGRYRAAALGAVLSAGSLLLVLPFTSLGSYAKLLNRLGKTFAHESYTVPGLLIQSGTAGLSTATFVGYAVGAAVLVVAYLRRSFPLAVAASLLLSPIVWLHYFELLVLPLAASSRRLSRAWFVPLLLFVVPGTAKLVRERHIVIGLVVLTVVTVLTERGVELRRRRLVLPAAQPSLD